MLQCTKHNCSFYGWHRNLKDGSSIQRVPISPNDKLQELKAFKFRVITLVQKQILLLSSDKIDKSMLQAFMYRKEASVMNKTPLSK